jgi:TatD DNase family protein
MMSLKNLRRIDAHCHVNFPAYGEESEAVIGRAVADGTGMVCVGTEYGTSVSAVETARRHDFVWAAIGFHPSHLSEPRHDEDEMGERRAEPFDASAFRRLIADNRDKVVAVGECGIDRNGLAAGADEAAEKAGQERVFREQVDLALEFGIPVIVHCRDLHAEVFEILAEYRRRGSVVKGVAHCFTGTWAEAEQYLGFGFYVSFAGMITYKPRSADREKGETLQDVARRVPPERLLIETDAPYLLPMPHRGRKIGGKPMNNEPAFVRHTAEFLSALRGEPLEKFEKKVLENTLRCFSLK